MHLTETIVSQTAQKVLGTMKISYEGQEIDLTPPWNRMTMIEAVAKYTGQDFPVSKTSTKRVKWQMLSTCLTKNFRHR